MTTNLHKKSLRIGSLIGCLLFLINLTLLSAQEVSETLSPWTTGTLDIHHINTGKGEAALFILPDGTTLLVDAGHTLRSKPRVTSPRPNSRRTPGEWIARYIKTVLPDAAGGNLDYALLSHFHGDHMGQVSEKSKQSSSKQYQLAGITAVGERIPIRKMIDRGWPDYNWPEPLDNPTMANYRKFLQWYTRRGNMTVERFRPGAADQIVLLHNPGSYPEFVIRNIAASGEVWTGNGEQTKQHIPSLESLPSGEGPSENMCSIAFRLTYGKFDYFAGGDLVGVPDEGAPPWHDLETPVARAVGPVDVNVLNHHGYLDSQNAFFLATLRPRVHIIQVWSPSHPSPRVLRRLLSTRIYDGPRDIFATNIMEENKVVIGSNLAKLKSDQGHILVRVAPGGKSYQLIILDDSAESYKVTAVHGPYQSR